MAKDQELRKVRDIIKSERISFETEKNRLNRQIAQLRRPPDGLSLREQLAYQFPYEPHSYFPSFIWQTAKLRPTHPKFRRKEEVKSWDTLNPDFVHEVLTDETSLALIRNLYVHMPNIVEAYENMPSPILRADFFRYLVLLARGGIYTDIDTFDLKPILDWIPAEMDASKIGLVIGIEADPDRPDWKDWYARRIQFCQWTIQAKPGHPVLRDIVAKITDEYLTRKSNGNLQLAKGNSFGSEIMEWTGPGSWTDSVFDYLNDPVKSGLKSSVGIENFTGLKKPTLFADVLVLPITSFSPGVKQMGAQDIDHPLAFVQHVFEGSWKNDKPKMK
ncbi:glycosyltransferase family 32 protein [Tortispora caseinolytica NRRL Y-17796]|uniref:Glycosyltransferase family 32 protein n=1 Tax=Tortispora caseinolytica NRRL Y-17796 TaxID=767744 RepID=A0A1E4TDE4_9ASCO|nr:glycosyltransferase family 32 protein [Tortispora caseinolytica NRRL Y-17796]